MTASPQPDQPLDEVGESAAEQFLTNSGLLQRWSAEALAIALKEVLADAGLHLRRIEQHGAILKLRLLFPASWTPSLRPKLRHQLRTIVKRTGYSIRHFWCHIGSNRRSVTVWVVPD